MSDLKTGGAIVLLAAIANASFALPMKWMSRWSWENIWLVWSAVSLLALPLAAAALTVPQLFAGYAEVAPAVIARVVFFGFAWGIAQVLFGLSVDKIGMALTFSIVLGTSAAVGTIVPFIRLHPELLPTKTGAFVVGGVVCVVGGMVLCARAGLQREREARTAPQNAPQKLQSQRSSHCLHQRPLRKLYESWHLLRRSAAGHGRSSRNQFLVESQRGLVAAARRRRHPQPRLLSIPAAEAPLLSNFARNNTAHYWIFCVLMSVLWFGSSLALRSGQLLSRNSRPHHRLARLHVTDRDLCKPAGLDQRRMAHCYPAPAATARRRHRLFDSGALPAVQGKRMTLAIARDPGAPLLYFELLREHNLPSTYDKSPFIDTGLRAEVCLSGWDRIASEILQNRKTDTFIVCIECYPGTLDAEMVSALASRLQPSLTIRASEAYRSATALTEMFARDLTSDPVFGRMNNAGILDFFDPPSRDHVRSRIRAASGLVLVVGTGSSLLVPPHSFLVYADLARWEIQRRQRQNLVGNLGLGNLDARPAEKYKRAFFLDWRAADRLKTRVLPVADFVLDTNAPSDPKMISGSVFRSALAKAVEQPIRLVPFFDPGPWGGQWMREKFDLPHQPRNFAWCFDCVPEENSLVLSFGERRFEMPAQNLVLLQPAKLMGQSVYDRFGMDFPIRFDLLDTMGGGNLSLQVHPLTGYIRDNFGMTYTQDESYYLLDAGPDAVVYLGTRTGVDVVQMESDLRRAQETDFSFPAAQYANPIPAKKHDHFLIPAGTLHCSGANCMVLEISATPYIFTFKMWDWGRLGLDGRPRPVHIDHGLNNIQWNRDTAWTRDELVNAIKPVAQGDGWTEESTGLHPLEFIETRRHWFRRTVEHDTLGTVHVLNLVEGSGVLVESPSHSFAPFAVHYAETFLVPAQVGRYTITPIHPDELCATIRANVRSIVP